MTRNGKKEFTNGAVDVLSTIIKHVMSSASEAETGALYYGCKRSITYRVTLKEMGHPQGKTPVAINNNTAHGLATGTMTSKASKSNDMRFKWLRCRKAQKLFSFLWARGPTNRADYPSKHHPASHHQQMRPKLVVDKILPQWMISLNTMYLYIHQVTFFHKNVWPFLFIRFFQTTFRKHVKYYSLARVCWSDPLVPWDSSCTYHESCTTDYRQT